LRLLQVQVDAVRREGFVGGFLVQRTQHALGRAGRRIVARNPEHVTAVGDLHAQAQLDLAQVLVEGAAEVGQAFVVLGFEDEIAIGGRSSSQA
jgi:hypothetical protein